MGLFDRFKQITGRIPIQSLLLGEYAFEAEITNVYGDMRENKRRINTSVYFEIYETNSAKILVRQNHKDSRYHVTAMPKNFESFAITIINEDTRVEYVFGLSEIGVLITSKDRKKTLAFNN